MATTVSSKAPTQAGVRARGRVEDDEGMSQGLEDLGQAFAPANVPLRSCLRRTLSRKEGVSVSFGKFTKVHTANLKVAYNIKDVAEDVPVLEPTPLAEDEDLRDSLTLLWNDIMQSEMEIERVTVNADLARTLLLFEEDEAHFEEYRGLLDYLREEVGVLERSEKLSPLEELYEMFIRMRAYACNLDRVLERPKEKHILGTIWLRLLAEERIDEAFKLLDELERIADVTIRAVKQEDFDQALLHRPSQEQTQSIHAGVNNEKFLPSWEEMLLFFDLPIAMYALERELFRLRYIDLIKAGLVQTMVNNQWHLAERIMDRGIPDDFKVILRRQDGVWDYDMDEALNDHPLRIADSYFSGFTKIKELRSTVRHKERLLLVLIRMGANKVVKGWLDAIPGSHSTTHDDGETKSMYWEVQKSWFASDEDKLLYEILENNTELMPPSSYRVEEELTSEYEMLTPLTCAAECGNHEIVELLLKKGADPFQENDAALRGLMSLHLSREPGQNGELNNREQCRRLILAEVDRRLKNHAKKEGGDSNAYWETVLVSQAALAGQSRAEWKPLKRTTSAMSQLSIPPKVEPPVQKMGSVLGRRLSSGIYSYVPVQRWEATKKDSPTLVTSFIRAIDFLLDRAFNYYAITNLYTIRALAITLYKGGVVLNKARNEMLVALVQKALLENKPGDETALIWLLERCKLYGMLVKGSLTAEEMKQQSTTNALVKKRIVPSASPSALAGFKAYMKARKATQSSGVTKGEIGAHAPIRESRNHAQFARDIFEKKLDERKLLETIARNGMVYLFDALKGECSLDRGVLGMMMEEAISNDQDVFVKELLPMLSDEMIKAGWLQAVRGGHFDVALVLLAKSLTNLAPEEHDDVVEEVLKTLIQSTETSMATVHAVLDLIEFTKQHMSPGKREVLVAAVESALSSDYLLNVHALREVLRRGDPLEPKTFTEDTLQNCVSHLESVLDDDKESVHGFDNQSFIDLHGREPEDDMVSVEKDTDDDDDKENDNGEIEEEELDDDIAIVCARTLLIIFGNVFPGYMAYGLREELFEQCAVIFAADTVTHLVLDMNGYHEHDF